MATIVEMIKIYNMTPAGNTLHDLVGALFGILDKLEDLPIEVIAERCYVSPATMSRLSKRLGFKTFGAFRDSITRELVEHPYINRGMLYYGKGSGSDDLAKMYFAEIRKILDESEKCFDHEYLNRIVDTIHNARKVSFYIYSAYDFPKTQFQFDMIITGKETAFLTDIDSQLSDARTLDEKCVVITSILGSLSGSYVASALSEAKTNGATIVAFAPKNDPVGERYADYMLDYNSSGTTIDHYYHDFSMSLINQIYRLRYME